MSKNILVTGGAGFIGSHLVDGLIDKGHKVTILDDLSGGLETNINQEAKFVKGSITNRDLVENIIQDTNIVYHLAAYAAEGLSHYVRTYNYMNNLIGSVNLINAAVKHNIERFVFTSSMAIYGSGNPPFDEKDTPHPEDPYGLAKVTVENDLRIAKEMFGLDFVIIRPHNFYGERQFLGDPYRNVIGIWMNRIMQNKSPLIYGNGEQTRAFSYVKDAIPSLIQAGFKKETRGEIINLGSSSTNAITLNELADKVLRAMDSELKPTHVSQRHEVKHAYSTTKKSEELLDFKDDTSLVDGLAKMASWAKTVGPMDPIIWETYELTKGLPDFWVNLAQDYPDAKKRINVLFDKP